MATSTTTTATTTTAFASCAAESDPARAAAEHPFGFAALYRAWLACRRGKRGTRKAQRYEMGLFDRLADTAQALQQHTWRPSRATRFVTLHPKPREILAAEFGDRVVHHLLVPWFERLFEPVFIFDSCANRRGKGTHGAVRRLKSFLLKAAPAGAALAAKSAGGEAIAGKPAPTGGVPAAVAKAAVAGGPYYLQLDIANFFNSIDRRKLFALLKARVARDARRPARDPRHAAESEAREYLWLARQLLTGNPALTARFQGRAEDLRQVPAHKQLANAPPETGLPIGNLSSQFFANVYLNELDQFVKHTLKARHYVRYVDDFVLLHPERAQLEVWRSAIIDFLRDKLGLALRDAGKLAPAGNGIDFLGYIVRPDYCLVRRRVVGHMNERLTRLGRRLIRADGAWVCPPAAGDAAQATLTSYFGHFGHARSARLRAQTLARHPWLAHLLALDENKQSRHCRSGLGREGAVKHPARPRPLRECGATPTPTSQTPAHPLGDETANPTDGCHVCAEMTADAVARMQSGAAPRLAQTTVSHPAVRPRIASGLQSARLKRVDRPPQVTSLGSQWRYFRQRYPAHVLLVQVGNRWECQAPPGAGLPPAFRRTAHPGRRPGLPETLSVAARLVPALKRALTRSRQPWCEAGENGYLKGGFKRRQIVAVWPCAPVGPQAAP
ncbi:MAG: RNA-directed DNA polymerase [Betaproteobacteria bacterium]|nr:RNA-directed DNA polymerase [Betaproteobacteria bacterium]